MDRIASAIILFLIYAGSLQRAEIFGIFFSDGLFMTIIQRLEHNQHQLLEHRTRNFRPWSYIDDQSTEKTLRVCFLSEVLSVIRPITDLRTICEPGFKSDLHYDCIARNALQQVPLENQSNNSAFITSSDEDPSSTSSEIVLKFEYTSSLTDVYEPKFLRRRKHRSGKYQKRDNNLTDTHQINQCNQRHSSIKTGTNKLMKNFSLSKGTRCITNEPTKTEFSTPSTSISIDSVEIDPCSVRINVLDNNVNQTRPDGSKMKSHSPVHSSKAEVFPEIGYNEYQTVTSKSWSDLNKSPIWTIGQQKFVQCLEHNTSETPLDGYYASGFFKRFTTVEISGIRSTPHHTIWPIPQTIATTPPKSESFLYEYDTSWSEQQGYMVYTIQEPRSVRGEISTHLGYTVSLQSAKLPPTKPDNEKFAMVDELGLSTGDHKIVSPIVKTDDTFCLFDPFVRANKLGSLQMTTSTKQLTRKLRTIQWADLPYSRRPNARPSVDPQLFNVKTNHFLSNDPIQKITLSGRKFRRRVKISLQQCPNFNELEASNLLIRLKIDPSSDSEIVISRKMEDRFNGAEYTTQPCNRITNVGEIEQKSDTLSICKVNTWIPLNNLESVPISITEGMTGCLITSFSSLSIPMSEIESIDTSFSWGLPETRVIRRCNSGKKASLVPNTVIVEVKSDEEQDVRRCNQSEFPYSGVCYFELSSTQVVPISQQPVKDLNRSISSIHRMTQVDQGGEIPLSGLWARTLDELNGTIYEHENARRDHICYHAHSHSVDKCSQSDVLKTDTYTIYPGIDFDGEYCKVDETEGATASDRVKNLANEYSVCKRDETSECSYERYALKSGCTVELSTEKCTSYCGSVANYSTATQESMGVKHRNLYGRRATSDGMDGFPSGDLIGLIRQVHTETEIRKDVTNTEKGILPRTSRIASSRLVCNPKVNAVNPKMTQQECSDNPSTLTRVFLAKSGWKSITSRSMKLKQAVVETGLFQRKRTKFLSGELTISEVENLRQQSLASRTNCGTSNCEPRKPHGLNSVASYMELKRGRKEANRRRARQVMFSMCVQRERNDELNFKHSDADGPVSEVQTVSQKSDTCRSVFDISFVAQDGPIWNTVIRLPQTPPFNHGSPKS